MERVRRLDSKTDLITRLVRNHRWRVGTVLCRVFDTNYAFT